MVIKGEGMRPALFTRRGLRLLEEDPWSHSEAPPDPLKEGLPQVKDIPKSTMYAKHINVRQIQSKLRTIPCPSLKVRPITTNPFGLASGKNVKVVQIEKQRNEQSKTRNE